VKTLTWLLGVMMILLELQTSTCGQSRWTALSLAAAVLWFFVGVVAGLVSLAKLVAGKAGAGALSGLVPTRGTAPAPKKEE
jgi:hypothetical protein